MNTIVTVGISLIGIFLLFIIQKKNKVLSDYFLVLTNVVLAGVLYSSIWVQQEFTPFRFVVYHVLPFWLFSVFLTYGVLLIAPDLLKRYWFWFYGYSLIFTAFITLDVVVSDYSASLLQAQYQEPDLIYHVFFKTHPLFVILTMLWFLRRLSAYQRNAKESLSSIETVQRQWLRYFSLIIIILYTLALVAFLLYNGGWIEDISRVYLVLNSGIVLAVFYLSYHGIRQYSSMPPVAIQGKRIADEHPSPPGDDPAGSDTKYATSSLSQDQIDQIYGELQGLFEREQIYVEPQLKIGQVADRLAISTHQLSQVINSAFHKPFYDFVNTYRVHLLQDKLRDPRNQAFTILSLAHDSGFNSKASLNRIFKEHTGRTPSQYQKAHLPA